MCIQRQSNYTKREINKIKENKQTIEKKTVYTCDRLL